MYDTDDIFRFLMDTHLKTPWIALLCMFLETLVLAWETSLQKSSYSLVNISLGCHHESNLTTTLNAYTIKHMQISSNICVPFSQCISIFPTSQDWLGPNMRLPQHIKPWKAHGLSHLFFSRHTLEKFKVSLPASRRPVKSIPTGVQSCFSSWMCIPLRSFVPNGNSNSLIQLASFIWQWPTISGSPGWAKFSHWHLRLAGYRRARPCSTNPWVPGVVSLQRFQRCWTLDGKNAQNFGDCVKSRACA